MIEKTVHTKDGLKIIKLTEQEIQMHAETGDLECKKYLCKKEIAACLTNEERINVLLKFLELK